MNNDAQNNQNPQRPNSHGVERLQVIAFKQEMERLGALRIVLHGINRRERQRHLLIERIELCLELAFFLFCRPTHFALQLPHFHLNRVHLRLPGSLFFRGRTDQIVGLLS